MFYRKTKTITFLIYGFLQSIQIAEAMIHEHCTKHQCELLGEVYGKRKFTPTKDNLKIEVTLYGGNQEKFKKEISDLLTPISSRYLISIEETSFETFDDE